MSSEFSGGPAPKTLRMAGVVPVMSFASTRMWSPGIELCRGANTLPGPTLKTKSNRIHSWELGRSLHCRQRSGDNDSHDDSHDEVTNPSPQHSRSLIEAPTRLARQTGQTKSAPSFHRSLKVNDNEAHPPGCPERSATIARRDWHVGNGPLKVAAAPDWARTLDFLSTTVMSCLTWRAKVVILK
jgi:hypothetical protein